MLERPAGGAVVRVPAAVASVVRGVPGMEIALRSRRLQAVAAQFLLGTAGLALITFVCLQLGFGLGRTAFAYVILLALVSLLGSFSVSVVLSVIAAACLDYFFAPPLFTFQCFGRYRQDRGIPDDVAGRDRADGQAQAQGPRAGREQGQFGGDAAHRACRLVGT